MNGKPVTELLGWVDVDVGGGGVADAARDVDGRVCCFRCTSSAARSSFRFASWERESWKTKIPTPLCEETNVDDALAAEPHDKMAAAIRHALNSFDRLQLHSYRPPSEPEMPVAAEPVPNPAARTVPERALPAPWKSASLSRKQV